MIRVAVVGLGWAGRELWLQRLLNHPAFDVVAAVDPDPASREAVMRPGGDRDLPVYADTEAITPQAVDLAVVAVPNHLHAEVAVDLLARGIPVFVEKPVCLTSAEADKLAQAEIDGRALLVAGSASRYRGDIGALYRLLPELGDIHHVELAWTRARGVPKAGGWFTSRSKAGGGVLFDLGWHLLDALTPILGPVNMAHVAGTTSDGFVNDPSWGAAWRQDGPRGGLGTDVEDTARGFLVSENGTSIGLRASWASHEARDVTLMRVEGSAGTAALRCTFGFSPNREPTSALTLTRQGNTERIEVPTEPIGIEYGRQLDDLPRLLADRDHRGNAVADALRIVRIIERFYAAALSVTASSRDAAHPPMSASSLP